MSKWNLGFGGVNLGMSGDADAEQRPESPPFRMLVIGNFSGHQPRSAFSSRKPLVVDRDNFDEVMARVGPQVTLQSGAGASLVIDFKELDDFTPDRLVARLPIFEELRTLREQLHRPATFEKAARVIAGWASTPQPPGESPDPPAKATAADILADMLGESPQSVSRMTAAVPSSGGSDWDQFLHEIVRPHLAESVDPRQADYEAIVDQAIGAQMRDLLHHPAFQAVEAAWRGLFFLVRRLETDEKLKLALLDVTSAEVKADLSNEDPTQTVLFRELVQKTIGMAGGQPWALALWLESFGSDVEGLVALAQVTQVAALAKTVVLAGASPRLVGATTFDEQPDPRTWSVDRDIAQAWAFIRGQREAAFLGLALPRVMLRLPYGRESMRTESFPFEEMPGGSRHEHYLWGPSSILCAYLLGQGFAENGWGLEPDDYRRVAGLPVHIVDEEGERVMKPITEISMRETTLERLVEQGLMVFISMPDRDAVDLARFQSVASEPTPLAGRWGQAN